MEIDHVKVFKFGGTSVRDAVAIENVVRIVQAGAVSPLLVVVSACAGVTDTLLVVVRAALRGDIGQSTSLLNTLRERHLEIAHNLLPDGHRAECALNVERDCLKLQEMIRDLARLRKPSAELCDEFASYGERWSSQLLRGALVERGVRTELIDARTVLRTNDEFSNATPCFEETKARVERFIRPHLKTGAVVVTQGFIGSTPDGQTTTLGRGGSDYSATIFGSALGVDEIRIWTDTDGILSADPRITSTARPLREISVEEATELAHFGAKVLHPSTLAPAMSQQIAVHVMNSMNPAFPGTIVKPTNGTQLADNYGVKSITGRKGLCTVAVRKDQRMNTFRFLQHIFDVLESHNKAVEFISNSETGVLVLTNDEDDHSSFVEELRHHDGVEIRDKLAIVCVVGSFSNGEQSILSQLHHSLLKASIPIYHSYQGISKHSVAVVIDAGRLEEAIRLLHDSLVIDRSA